MKCAKLISLLLSLLLAFEPIVLNAATNTPLPHDSEFYDFVPQSVKNIADLPVDEQIKSFAAGFENVADSLYRNGKTPNLKPEEYDPVLLLGQRLEYPNGKVIKLDTYQSDIPHPGAITKFRVTKTGSNELALIAIRKEKEIVRHIIPQVRVKTFAINDGFLTIITPEGDVYAISVNVLRNAGFLSLVPVATVLTKNAIQNADSASYLTNSMLDQVKSDLQKYPDIRVVKNEKGEHVLDKGDLIVKNKEGRTVSVVPIKLISKEVETSISEITVLSFIVNPEGIPAEVREEIASMLESRQAIDEANIKLEQMSPEAKQRLVALKVTKLIQGRENPTENSANSNYPNIEKLKNSISQKLSRINFRWFNSSLRLLGWVGAGAVAGLVTIAGYSVFIDHNTVEAVKVLSYIYKNCVPPILRSEYWWVNVRSILGMGTIVLAAFALTMPSVVTGALSRVNGKIGNYMKSVHPRVEEWGLKNWQRASIGLRLVGFVSFGIWDCALKVIRNPKLAMAKITPYGGAFKQRQRELANAKELNRANSKRVALALVSLALSEQMVENGVEIDAATVAAVASGEILPRQLSEILNDPEKLATMDLATSSLAGLLKNTDVNDLLETIKQDPGTAKEYYTRAQKAVIAVQSMSSYKKSAAMLYHRSKTRLKEAFKNTAESLDATFNITRTAITEGYVATTSRIRYFVDWPIVLIIFGLFGPSADPVHPENLMGDANGTFWNLWSRAPQWINEGVDGTAYITIVPMILSLVYQGIKSVPISSDIAKDVSEKIPERTEGLTSSIKRGFSYLLDIQKSDPGGYTVREFFGSFKLITYTLSINIVARCFFANQSFADAIRVFSKIMLVAMPIWRWAWVAPMLMIRNHTEEITALKKDAADAIHDLALGLSGASDSDGNSANERTVFSVRKLLDLYKKYNPQAYKDMPDVEELFSDANKALMEMRSGNLIYVKAATKLYERTARDYPVYTKANPIFPWLATLAGAIGSTLAAAQTVMVDVLDPNFFSNESIFNSAKRCAMFLTGAYLFLSKTAWDFYMSKIDKAIGIVREGRVGSTIVDTCARGVGSIRTGLEKAFISKESD